MEILFHSLLYNTMWKYNVTSDYHVTTRVSWLKNCLFYFILFKILYMVCVDEWCWSINTNLTIYCKHIMIYMYMVFEPQIRGVHCTAYTAHKARNPIRFFFVLEHIASNSKKFGSDFEFIRHSDYTCLLQM